MLTAIPVVISALLVIGAGWIGFSFWSFSRAITAEVAQLREAAQPNTETITEARLAELPAPVARHLRQAGVIGQTIPQIVTVIQTGRIRSKPDANWMAFVAEQTYSTNPPGFVWQVWLPNRSLPVVFGRDHYLEGDGRITMKMLGTLSVADVGGGSDLNAAALMRYLNEMMWFPAALAGRNLAWTPVDDTSADVTLADHGMSATARLFFDADGKIVNFSAQRLNLDANGIQTWETPVSGYRTLGSMTIPKGGQAVWQTPEGPFAYVELEVTDVTLE